MKKILFIMIIILLPILACSKKNDENSVTKDDSAKAEKTVEKKVDLTGVKITGVRFDGNLLNGVIENRSDRILDSLVIRIQFINDFDSLPIKFDLPVVPGDDDKVVPAGFAKQFKYEFENPTWSHAKNIEARIVSGDWEDS